MVDISIRRNENCIIGMPRCDFAFSSARTCFIAYGFEDSPLEKDLLLNILEDQGIQPEEADATLAPAQNAFCAKICSKIITAQFCVVLLNNDERNGDEIPNANVNMEYGMMLGFNKYIIPFQRASQKLPFNVAGLDTIKYSEANFKVKAQKAIKQAILETQQNAPPPQSPDQILETFALAKKALVNPVTSEGDRNIFDMGKPLGFNLLNDFSGMKYIYLGNFTSLRPEAIIWRVNMLIEILDDRIGSMDLKTGLNIYTKEQIEFMKELLKQINIWILTTSNEDVKALKKTLKNTSYNVEIFSIDDVRSELEQLQS